MPLYVQFLCSPCNQSLHLLLTADSTVPGLGVRVEDVHLYPILLLHYGLRDEDVDDGQGETNLRLDFSNTYRFEGVWSVAG